MYKNKRSRPPYFDDESESSCDLKAPNAKRPKITSTTAEPSETNSNLPITSDVSIRIGAIELLRLVTEQRSGKETNQTSDLLSGREAELLVIESHFQKCLNEGFAYPIYVSGTPGSGKTALIHRVLEGGWLLSLQPSLRPKQTDVTLQEQSESELVDDYHGGSEWQIGPYWVSVNCATDLRGPQSSLASTLISHLITSYNNSSLSQTLNIKLPLQRLIQHTKTMGLKEALRFVLERLKAIHQQRYLSFGPSFQPKPADTEIRSAAKGGLLIVVVLDEIDHLLGASHKYNTDLHCLFDLWQQEWGFLSIIGIANTYDLIERHMPLLGTAQTEMHNNAKGGTRTTVSTSTTAMCSNKGDGEAPSTTEISKQQQCQQQQQQQQQLSQLHFKPYTASQLESILHRRLQPLQTSSSDCASTPNVILYRLFDPKAVKYMTAKIAKLPGDRAGDARLLLELATEALLDSHSSILDSHSSILDCHSSILDSHSSLLDCHSSILDSHDLADSSSVSRPFNDQPLSLDKIVALWKLKMPEQPTTKLRDENGLSFPSINSITAPSSNPSTNPTESPALPAINLPTSQSTSISSIPALSHLTMLQKLTLYCLWKLSNGGPAVRGSLLESKWKSTSKALFAVNPPSIPDLHSSLALLEGIGIVSISVEKNQHRKTYQMKVPAMEVESLLKHDIFFKPLF